MASEQLRAVAYLSVEFALAGTLLLGTSCTEFIIIHSSNNYFHSKTGMRCPSWNKPKLFRVPHFFSRLQLQQYHQKVKDTSSDASPSLRGCKPASQESALTVTLTERGLLLHEALLKAPKKLSGAAKSAELCSGAAAHLWTMSHEFNRLHVFSKTPSQSLIVISWSSLV